MSATGTRFDSVAQTAIPEEEINRQQKEKLKKLQMLEEEDKEEERSLSLSGGEEDGSPRNQLKKYFRRKR